MTSSKSTYETPLNSRYASKEMQFLFSPDKKFRTWRRLWIALAESERELGLPISQEQIDELRRSADDINYEAAEARERLVRHDVMAHVYAYGEQCPAAKPIIHLGATSCYVGDNADVIIMHEALELIRRIAPREAYLTHMSHDIGRQAATEATLPPHVHMAYDTLRVEIGTE